MVPKMMCFLFLLLASPLASAQSFSKPMSGFQAELSGSGGVHSGPQRLTAGGAGSLGIWWGPYDESYAIGRFNAVVLEQRVETATSLRLTPGLAYRRGIDLLVVKAWGEVGGGLELEGASAIPVAHVGGGVKYRFRPYLGAVARLDAGVALPSTGPQLRTHLSLGLEWSQPWKRPQMRGGESD